ncbi:hypothetical protein PPACK8108_LOCUS10603, partial [Phakopsora pachyrhizi]
MSDKEDENQSQKANIPKLNGDNVMMWNMRIQSPLLQKSLPPHCPSDKEKARSCGSDNICTTSPLNPLHDFKGDMKTYIRECQRLMNQLAIVCIDIPDDVLSYRILAKLCYDSRDVEELVKRNDGDVGDNKNIEGKDDAISASPDKCTWAEVVKATTTRYNHHVDAILMNENMIKNPNQVLLKLSEVVHIEEARKRENLDQE